MKSNLGNIDRIVRILISIVIGVLYFTHEISGTAALILIVLAGIFILTSFMNYCPLYALFGISTRKKNK